MDQKNTIYGPRIDSYINTEQPLGELFFNSLKEKNPEQLLLARYLLKKRTNTNKNLNCEELLKSSIKLSLNLSYKLNVGKDSVITLIAPNSWKYPVVVLAALFNGAKVHLIYHESTQWELQQLYKQCKPDVVFCTTQHLDDNFQLKEEGFWSGHLVLLNGKEVANNAMNFEKLLTGRNAEEIANFHPSKVDSQQIAIIVQSSGTTGFPKIVNLTHQNLTNCLGYMQHPDEIAIESGDKTIGYLPPAHIFGFAILLGYILFDGQLIFMEKFLPQRFLQIIHSHKITKLFATPSIVQFLVNSSLTSKYDTSSIKEIFIGTSNFTLEARRNAIERLGVEIRQAYGMTESCGGIAITPKNCEKLGTIGKLRPHIQVQIRDISTGKPLGPNETGEICVKGPTICKTGLQEDGFFKTGDIGYYDNEEFFYFVDRLKEMIKYKGFQVAPRELEKLLEEHPAVKEAAVIGKPDARCGEIPVAFVVKQPDREVSEEELIQYIAGKVAPHKRLNGGLKFVGDIPKNKMGKKMKNQLKELL